MLAVVPLVLVAVALPAAAEVYSTPTIGDVHPLHWLVDNIRIAQVSTAGEDTDNPDYGFNVVAVNANGGRAESSGVSVSNGGDAVGYSGVAVSNGGNAGGALGVAHGGQAQGNADYFGLFDGAAIATTGDARYADLSASVFGDASGDWGFSVTGEGSISVNTEVEAAYNAEGGIEASAGLFVRTGVLVAETPAMLEQIAMNPQDPAATAQKLQDLALLAPEVAQEQVQAIIDGGGSSSPESSDSPMAASSDKPPRKKWLGGFPSYAQPNDSTCVMTSVAMVLGHRGYSYPGIYSMHREAGGKDGNGLTMRAARPVFNRYYQGSDDILYTEIKDQPTLLNAFVLDVWKYNHGLVVPTKAETMGAYWPYDRPTDKGGHAIAGWGYNFDGATDYVTVMDPYDSRLFANWGDRPNPLGSHTLKLEELWIGFTGMGSPAQYIDW